MLILILTRGYVIVAYFTDLKTEKLLLFFMTLRKFLHKIQREVLRILLVCSNFIYARCENNLFFLRLWDCGCWGLRCTNRLSGFIFHKSGLRPSTSVGKGPTVRRRRFKPLIPSTLVGGGSVCETSVIGGDNEPLDIDDLQEQQLGGLQLGLEATRITFALVWCSDKLGCSAFR